MYLLDTNICIDFLDGRSEPLARRMEDNFGRLTISTITAAELFVGNRSSQDRLVMRVRPINSLPVSTSPTSPWRTRAHMAKSFEASG